MRLIKMRRGVVSVVVGAVLFWSSVDGQTLPPSPANPCRVTVVGSGTVYNCSNAIGQLNFPFFEPTGVNSTWAANTTAILLRNSRVLLLGNRTFTGLSNLTTLDLSSNQIDAIQDNNFVDGLTSLATLNLRFNQLTLIEDDSFVQLTSLRTLNLSGNMMTRISDLAFNGLVSLTDLDIGCNGLNFISNETFLGLSQLQRLQLRNNQITLIAEGAFIDLRNLDLLDISRLRLQGGGGPFTNSVLGCGPNGEGGGAQLPFFGGLTALQPRQFEGASNVTILHLDGNRITTLVDHAFFGLTNLTNLTLDMNSINVIRGSAMSDLSRLVDLSLVGNNISLIEDNAFSAIGGITELLLRGNSLTNVRTNTFNGLSSLEFLTLTDNGITFLPDDVFSTSTGLVTLQIMNNRITGIANNAFRGLQNLQDLYLSGNFLSAIPLSGLPNLRALVLVANSFVSIPDLTNQPLLTSLSMAANQVPAVTRTTFTPHANLAQIDLSNNRITLVADDGFSVFPALTSLRMASNPLAITTRPGVIVQATSCGSTGVLVSECGIDCCVLPSVDGGSCTAPPPVNPPTAQPTPNFAAEIARLNAQIAALSVCGEGTLRLSNGTCVPDCGGLARRGVSCQGACPATAGLTTPAPGTTASSSGSDSGTAILFAVVAVILVVIIIVLLVVGVPAYREARAAAKLVRYRLADSDDLTDKHVARRAAGPAHGSVIANPTFASTGPIPNDGYLDMNGDEDESPPATLRTGGPSEEPAQYNLAKAQYNLAKPSAPPRQPVAPTAPTASVPYDEPTEPVSTGYEEPVPSAAADYDEPVGQAPVPYEEPEPKAVTQPVEYAAAAEYDEVNGSATGSGKSGANPEYQVFSAGGPTEQQYRSKPGYDKFQSVTRTGQPGGGHPYVNDAAAAPQTYTNERAYASPEQVGEAAASEAAKDAESSL